jgi:DNA repair protein RadC
VVAMKEMAPRDRPREKLEQSGAGALGDNELLAIILGEGVQRRNALELANDVLVEVGGIEGIARASREDLRRRKGIGTARAGRIIAAIEFGRRTMRPPATREQPQILSPAAAAAFLAPEHGACAVERFGILVLDVKHRVRRTLVLSTGGIDATCVNPREVFRAAVAYRAHALIAFHNHPSGDPTPSPEDRELTQRLRAAGEVVGIELLDHIILANEKYHSFRDALLASAAVLPSAAAERKRKRSM